MNEFNPYEAPQSAVEDLPEIEEWGLASRGARLGAWFLDFVIWMASLSPFILQGFFKERARHGGPDFDLGTWVMVLGVAAILGVLILDLTWLSSHGQTIGKRLLSIRIIRSNGDRASLGRLFWIRGALPGLVGIIPVVGRLFPLVDALFIFGQEKRCLHDLIADTIVIQA